MDRDNKKSEIIKNLMTSEFVPTYKKDALKNSEYTKISYSDLAMLGAGVSTLLMSFQEIAKSGNDDVLYRSIVNGSPGKLPYAFKDGSGFMGSYINSDGKTAQARLQEVPNTHPAYNMTMIYMVAILMHIEKRLNDIQETQEEILKFLQDDKRSELDGNLYFLTDILNNYKYNWDNETYRNNMHVKVQDIKQHSEQNIIFYRTQINRLLDKRSLLITDQNVKNNLKKVESNFKDYRLALYLYGFTSFLEVILLENFDAEFLNSVVHKIEDYSNNYLELYTECYNQLEENSSISMQSFLLGGLSAISGTIGKTVEKLPIISKSQLDETLIDAHETLEKTKKDNTTKTMQQFITNKNSCVYQFIDNINTINKLYNQSSELLIGQDSVYLKFE